MTIPESYPQEDPDHEIDLKALMLALWQKRVVFILLFFVVNSVVLVTSFLLPKQYRVVGTFLVVSNTSQLGLPQLGGLMGFGLDVTKPSNAQMMGILASRQLAKRVVERIGFEKMADNFHLKPIQENEEDLLKSMMEKIQVKKDKNDIFSLEAVAYSPQMSVDICNAYLEELGRFLNEASLSLNFKVIDEAILPLHKFKPSIRKNLFLSSFLIGVIFIFYVIGLEMWNQKTFRPFLKK